MFEDKNKRFGWETETWYNSCFKDQLGTCIEGKRKEWYRPCFRGVLRTLSWEFRSCLIVETYSFANKPCFQGQGIALTI
jgi:hypothetical protein